MADGDDLPSDKRKNNNPDELDEVDDVDMAMKIVELDLGDHNPRKLETNRLGNQNIGAGSSSSDGIRRDENPFSFKHFLRFDSNYQNKGARPKVYCDGRPVRDASQAQIINENPSILPDFVQDHLVIEQCLSNGPTSNNYNNIGVQLPDFTQCIPQTSESNLVEQNITNDSVLGRPQAEFPLDLPLNLNNGRPVNSNEVAVSTSLPDFLNDGAVRSQAADNLSLMESPERDPERLQRELDLVRQQLVQQTNHSDLLQRELESVRNQEHEYTQNLIKALEQVEDNLERSNKRAALAESTVLKLKQEIGKLKKENYSLKLDKASQEYTEGAAGGPGTFTEFNQCKKMANELRNAASTAENSLRQLLSGVDNLRMMASTLENMHRIEDNNPDKNSGSTL